MKMFEKLPNGAIEINTEPFRLLTNRAVDEMRTQIRYMKRPTIRIKILLIMVGIATLSAFAAGYYIRESMSLKSSRDYWYREYVQATRESE